MPPQILVEKWRQMSRKKPLNVDMMETPLQRCLSTFDLTFLGIGFMLGAGIFVVTGSVMREKAGPATFVAYGVAGIVAILNALCYAELASRFPKAGSGYIYAYISSGELVAFVIGWSMILEYVLSIASVARGWSGTIDTLSHHAISNFSITHFGRIPILNSYPDFLALGIIIVLSLFLLLGSKISVTFNTIITFSNLAVILFAIITMLVKAEPKTFAPASHGGFIPFSFFKVISAASTCFYAYIGFDGLTICVEEAKNPKRAMPIALTISVLGVGLLMVLASLSLALFVPWFSVERGSAFTGAFQLRGMTWASYIVGYGSLFGITASLFSSLYSMPRIVYAMASDGLIFRFLGNILEKTQVPFVATVIFGTITGLFALVLDITTLADFLSIGTLITFTIVNATVIILRYRPASRDDFDDEEEYSNHQAPCTLYPRFAAIPILKDLPAGRAVIIALVVFTISCTFAIIVMVSGVRLNGLTWWIILLFIFFITFSILSFLVMAVHQQNITFDSFKVPAVPLVPCGCIVLNVALIVNLSALTWIRYFVWLAIGLLIYVFYGMKNSSLNAANVGETHHLLNEDSSSSVTHQPTDYDAAFPTKP